MTLKTTRWMVALLAAGLVASACADEEDDNPNQQDAGMTADTVEEDSGSSVDATGEDAEADDVAEEDTASEDTGGVDDRLLITRFAYRQKAQTCPTQSCTFGVSVNANSGTITKVENGQGLDRTMNNTDTDDLIVNVVTQDVYDRMEGGWDCGTPDSPELVYEFEARIWDGADYVESIQDITGCVGADSTEADAQLVQDTIAYLENLRDQYFTEE